jgi:hypothetical protein
LLGGENSFRLKMLLVQASFFEGRTHDFNVRLLARYDRNDFPKTEITPQLRWSSLRASHRQRESNE